MIRLHKINGGEVVINAELIESLEPGPQTVVSLTTGNRYIVRETTDDVLEKVLEYKRLTHPSSKAAKPIGGLEAV